RKLVAERGGVGPTPRFANARPGFDGLLGEFVKTLEPMRNEKIIEADFLAVGARRQPLDRDFCVTSCEKHTQAALCLADIRLLAGVGIEADDDGSTIKANEIEVPDGETIEPDPIQP